jgi:5'(3')-deoxyribonucleotidase
MDFWQAGVEAGVIFNNAPYRGAVDAVNKVYNAGHVVHIITHRGWKERPWLAEDATRTWANDNGYKYHTLNFSEDKTIIRTDYFIEDNVDNYKALEEAGTEVYLLTRPWNEGLEGYRRVRSIGEFVKKIPGID